jgi:secreted trypsin-like serine protease
MMLTNTGWRKEIDKIMFTRKSTPVTLIFIIILATSFGLLSPVNAITWGQLDDSNLYPNVGAVVIEFDDGLFLSCSGTLINETAFLTAAHCTSWFEDLITEGEVNLSDVYVSFNPLDPLNTTSLLGVSQIITHPDYRDFIPTSNPYDVGLLILEEPVIDIMPAVLPEERFLDRLRKEGKLRKGSNVAKFTVVGYGGILDWPPPEITYPDTRSYSYSGYQYLLKAWLRITQNHATGNGGSCYGDSGGPIFWEAEDEQILVAITSWGDASCVSASFNYRIDLPEILDFIKGRL